MRPQKERRQLIMSIIAGAEKITIVEAVAAPCADCPFRKDSRRESLTCENMIDSVERWEIGDEQLHSCHKTHKAALGYKPGYEGPVMACAGSLASAQKSGFPLSLPAKPVNEVLVWSFDELKQVYKSAIRRIRRWERKKERILKHCGLRMDPMDSYITGGAVHASVNEKQWFFNTLIDIGYMKGQ